MTAILEMRNITKRFGPVVANDDVSFSVKKVKFTLYWVKTPGKWKLMNILFGL